MDRQRAMGSGQWAGGLVGRQMKKEKEGTRVMLLYIYILYINIYIYLKDRLCPEETKRRGRGPLRQIRVRQKQGTVDQNRVGKQPRKKRKRKKLD